MTSKTVTTLPPLTSIMSAPAVNQWLTGSEYIGVNEAPIIIYEGEPYYYTDDLQVLLSADEFRELSCDVITFLTTK